jgi:hypothetical protein
MDGVDGSVQTRRDLGRPDGIDLARGGSGVVLASLVAIVDHAREA